MEAIKKKMQGMKLEKDNAVDRAETAENQARDANLRADKVGTKSWIFGFTKNNFWKWCAKVEKKYIIKLFF